MLIDMRTLTKADPRLQGALEAAAGPEPLRVLLTIRGEITGPDRPPHPSEFASREEYRGALIARRQKLAGQAFGDTLRALAELGLRVFGGDLSRAVVASGTAAQIAAALATPGVDRGYLDRPIELIRPVG